EVFGQRVKNTPGTPEGWWYLRDYLDQVHLIPWSGTHVMGDPVPGLISSWGRGQLKYRFVDEAMKRIYVKALAKDPFVTAKFFLVDQPLHMARQLAGIFTNGDRNVWPLLMILSSAGIFAFAFSLEEETERDNLAQVLLLSGGVFVASCLPGLWAHVN